MIIDAIRNAKKGLRTGEIHDALKKSGYGLNYNTLRSYVAKMRSKGLIKKATPQSYHWIPAQKIPAIIPPDAPKDPA
jgi:repressor of nif and glnA expression